MKNKKNQITLNITIDLDEIKKYVKEYADDETGLESSGGLNPTDLARAWDEMDIYLPDSISPLTNAFTEIINLLVDIHNESTDK